MMSKTRSLITISFAAKLFRPWIYSGVGEIKFSNFESQLGSIY